MEYKVQIEKHESGKLVDSILYKSIIGKLTYLIQTRCTWICLINYTRMLCRGFYATLKTLLNMNGLWVYVQGAGNYMLSGYSDNDHARSLDEKRVHLIWHST